MCITKKDKACQDDSDSCDFNEIDHEIQDILHRSESESKKCGENKLTKEF